MMEPTDPKKPKWEQNIEKLKELVELSEQMTERYRAAREGWIQSGVPGVTRSFVGVFKSGWTLILQPAEDVTRDRALLDGVEVAFHNSGWAVAFQCGDETVVIHPEAPGVH